MDELSAALVQRYLEEKSFAQEVRHALDGYDGPVSSFLSRFFLLSLSPLSSPFLFAGRSLCRNCCLPFCLACGLSSLAYCFGFLLFSFVFVSFFPTAAQTLAVFRKETLEKHFGEEGARLYDLLHPADQFDGTLLLCT